MLRRHIKGKAKLDPMPPSGKILNKMTVSNGTSVKTISDKKPVLLIFLRHFGCTFCREALAEIAKKKTKIESEGVEIVFVHMSDKENADKYFKRYGLEGALHICDPKCLFYQSFGLVKGSFNQLFGLQVWMRGLDAGVLKGHGIGNYIGDGFQMPGVFMIFKGEIRESFIHKYASDRPNYEQLANCCAV
ncbi:MAG: peroxiredoxin-like family protein [Bacteroidota bacterium]